MCTRPFRPRPRRDPRRKGPRPRRDWDVGHFVRDETETLRVREETETKTFQLPRPWPRRMVKKIKHHKINWTSKHFVFVMLWDFGARALCALRGIASPENYLTLSPMETISRKQRLNVLITLYQNACLLVLSLPGSFVNKNAIKHKIKVSVLLCRLCLRFWRILRSKCDLEHYSSKKFLNLGVRAQ